MTDLEKYKELLDEFNLEYEVHLIDDSVFVELKVYGDYDDENTESTHNKVDGYSGFYCNFIFNNGAFTSASIGE